MARDRQIGFMLTLALVIGLVAGITLAGFGVWLVALGATGNAVVELLGQHLNSTNVGLSAIFIGAVTLLFVVRRTLASVDRFAALAPDEPNPAPAAPVTAVPTDDIIERVRTLSDDQAQLFKAIFTSKNGLNVADLLDRMAVSRAEVVYRARDLRERGLVEILTQTDQKFELSRPVRELKPGARSKIAAMLEHVG